MNTNEEIENIDSENDEELESEELDEELDEEATDEERDAYLEKMKSNNRQLFVRLQKAQGKTLVDGKWVNKQPEIKEEPKKEEVKEVKEIADNSEISQKDLITLMKSKISEDDIDEVVEYATFRKISIADALKSDVIKGILATKEEQRKTAEASNTNGGKRGNSTLSDEALLSNAQKGELPDSDEDMKRLAYIQIHKNR